MLKSGVAATQDPNLRTAGNALADAGKIAMFTPAPVGQIAGAALQIIGATLPMFAGPKPASDEMKMMR